MKKLLVAIVLILAVAAVIIWKISSSDSAGPDQELKLYGNVDIREVTLAFRVGGRVETLLKDEGEAVQAGELMAVLDAVPYEEEVQQAQAEVAVQAENLRLLQSGYRAEEIEQARAQVQEAVASLALADKNLARQRSLAESEAGRGQELDLAIAARDQAAAALESARARLKLLEAGFRDEEIARAEASLDLARAREKTARTRLDDTRLLAPSDGVVRTRVAEQGAVVAGGSPVFVLSIQENPWVRAYVPEPQLGRIRPGMEVEVRSDAHPGKPYMGRVGFISPTAEFTPKTVHTEELRVNLVYRFRVILEDVDEALRQGMPVTVVIPAEHPSH